jgi:formylglycine-generating enzyme required for sulfatase activity
MKKTCLLSIAVCMSISSFASADTFGTGANQFEIGFVTISGDASTANGIPIGNEKTFVDPESDYRIGVYEITNGQWNKFVNIHGAPIGNPSYAYNVGTYQSGTNIPATGISWYEAAQFVNWLNTNTGHSPAYKFIGTPGTSNYNFTLWKSTDAGYNPDNQLRNSNAYYFLPTEDEWVKAGFWNGINLQTYATLNGAKPIAGVEENYAYRIGQGWNVGAGSIQLNGTYDIMGNVAEWTESLWGTAQVIRGGSWMDGYIDTEEYIGIYSRVGQDIAGSFANVGFRVASIPEPATVSLLALSGLALLRRRK